MHYSERTTATSSARLLIAVFTAAALSTLPAHAQQRPAPPPAAKAAPPPAPTPPPEVAGVWIDHTGRGAVELQPCGNFMCGRIVWLKEPLDAKGRALTDELNPDRKKRSQPICGLQIIGDVKPVAGNVWDNGWIYNPEDGGTFSVELKLRGPDRLQVMGYAGVKFLNETYVWKRAPQNQPRCQTIAARM